MQDFEAVITGAVRSGYLTLKQAGDKFMLFPGTNDLPSAGDKG